MAAAPHTRLVKDPQELADLFGRRPDVHLYGLGDLEEPFWSASRWLRRGDAVVGTIPLPGSDVTAVYAVSDADPDGSLALLLELLPGLPTGTLITGPVGLAEAASRVASIIDLEPHVKMVLKDPSRRPIPGDADLRPLSTADASVLEDLHAADPGAAFWSPSMLADETYVGLWHQGALLAAAGTHLLSPTYRVAAIGGVFTHPAHRGRGYGAQVTAATLARIGGRADTIGLNVAAANMAARRVYAGLGFEVCWTYEEVLLSD